MMEQVILSMLPPEIRQELFRVLETLQKEGRAETVFQVPKVGTCRITIEKMEEKV
jgi:hypothetical protein